jgi:hypothetical protein
MNRVKSLVLKSPGLVQVAFQAFETTKDSGAGGLAFRKASQWLG